MYVKYGRDARIATQVYYEGMQHQEVDGMILEYCHSDHIPHATVLPLTHAQ
jgi:hypothetical protein